MRKLTFALVLVLCACGGGSGGGGAEGGGGNDVPVTQTTDNIIQLEPTDNNVITPFDDTETKKEINTWNQVNWNQFNWG